MRRILVLAALVALVAAGRDVVELTDKNFDSLVMNDENGVWFVKFYAPWCGHCKALAPKWEKLGTSLKGMVNVAKLDCTVHQGLCARYQVQGYPTVKIFASDKRKPIDYQGPREEGPMSKFALSHLSSANVATVKGAELDAALARPGTKIVLFTDKKTTPPLFKALANAFTGVASFIEVRNDKDATILHTGAAKMPVLMAVREDGQSAVYPGKLQIAALNKWIVEQLGELEEDAGAAAAADPTGSADATPRTPPTPQAPVVIRPDFVTEITGENFEKICVTRKGICVLFYMPLEATSDREERYLAIPEDLRRIVMDVFDRYNKDKVSIGWVDPVRQPRVLSDQKSAPTLVLLKGARRRAVALDARFSFDAVAALMDRAIGGDATFEALDDLPEFV